MHHSAVCQEGSRLSIPQINSHGNLQTLSSLKWTNRKANVEVKGTSRGGRAIFTIAAVNLSQLHEASWCLVQSSLTQTKWQRGLYFLIMTERTHTHTLYLLCVCIFIHNTEATQRHRTVFWPPSVPLRLYWNEGHNLSQSELRGWRILPSLSAWRSLRSHCQALECVTGKHVAIIWKRSKSH